MPMKRKTKVRIARFTRQVPILREMQALRNESVLRLVVQAAFVGGCTGGVIGVFRCSMITATRGSSPRSGTARMISPQR